MLIEILLVFALMLLSFGAISVGVIAGRQPIKGSCGGIGSSCDSCQGDAAKCPKREGSDPS